MDESYREEPAPEFRLGDILDIIKRRKWWAIVPTVVLTAVAVVIAVYLPPVYRAEGTILIERPNVPPDLIDSTVTSYAGERIEKIRREFITTDNLTRIIHKYDLFPVMRANEPMPEVVQAVRERIHVDFAHRSSRDPAVAFGIAFDYGEPEKARQVASELASWYLRENLRTRQEKSRETAEFLEQQTAALGSEVRRLEADLAKFKKENAGQLPSQQDLNRAQLLELQRSLRDLQFEEQTLRERRADLAKTLAAVESGRETGAVPSDTRLAQLRDELAQLSSRYTDKHPDIVRLKREIAALEALRRGESADSGDGESAEMAAVDTRTYELKEQIAAADRRLNMLARRDGALREDIAETKERLRQAAAIEDEYAALQRLYENAVTDYRTLRRKKLTADMGASLELNRKGERFTLVEPPQQPLRPFKPDRKLIVLAGFVLSFGFGCGLMLAVELADGRLQSARKLETVTGVAPLVVIPHIRTRREIVRAWAWRGASGAGVLAAVAGALFYVHTSVQPLDIVAQAAERQVGAQLDRLLK